MASVARRVSAKEADAVHPDLALAVRRPLGTLALRVLHLVLATVLRELYLGILGQVVELVRCHGGDSRHGAREPELRAVVGDLRPVLGDAALPLEEVVLQSGASVVVHLAAL